MVHTGTANQGHYFSYIRDPKLDKRESPPDVNGNPTRIIDGCNVDQTIPPPPVLASPPSPDAESATTSPSTTSLSADDNSGHSGHSGSAEDDEVNQATTTTTGIAAAISTATASEGGTTASPPVMLPGFDDGKCVSGGNPSVQRTADEQKEDGHHWREFNDTVVKEWAVEGRRGGNEAGQADTDGGDGVGRAGGLSTDCFGGQQTMQVTVRRVGTEC